jgi:LPPG:FO 2-phospho-L-lactate transferase
MLDRLGQETWFRLGDRDLALHLTRTRLLREGLPLSEVTRRVREALGIGIRILPMTDDSVSTVIETPEGTLPFQDYFVRLRCCPKVLAVGLQGIERARPAPGVLDAIADATAILICPSNPVVSVGPVLALPGIREAIARAPAPVLAISPIIGGKAVKGPADRMLKDLGHVSSALGVARLYEKLADIFVLDRVDEALRGEIEKLGMQVSVLDTIMSSPARARALGRAVLSLLPS